MSNKEQSYRFEAVVVYLSKETDANFVKDLVAKVKSAPIKLCVG